LAVVQRLFFLGEHHSEVIATGNRQHLELHPELCTESFGRWIVLRSKEAVQVWKDLLDVGRVNLQELVNTLGELAFKLSHLCGEFEVEGCGQQAITFIGPGQGDLVEVLSDLSSERPQPLAPNNQ